MVDLGAGGVGSVEDVLPQLVGAGEGLLVGGHDTDTLAKCKRVCLGNILRASVVDENNLGWSGGEVFDNLGQGQRGLGAAAERIDNIAQVNAGVVVVKESLAAGGNVAEAQLGRGSLSSQGLKLCKKALANAAGACSYPRNQSLASVITFRCVSTYQ